MDGRWVKYWFNVICLIVAWSADLFARILAFTSQRAVALTLMAYAVE
jgi:hypothetical protein